MRTRLIIPAALAFVSLSALAAFTGDYAPANWTPLTQTFGCGSSAVNTAGMPNTLVLETITGCGNIGAGYQLTNPIHDSGTIKFDWSYSGTGAGHNTSYTLNGAVTTLASGAGSSSGTVTLPVAGGQTFSFNLAGGTNANVTFSNFSFTLQQPTSIPTLEFWAKLGLAGLLAATALVALRRRAAGARSK